MDGIFNICRFLPYPRGWAGFFLTLCILFTPASAPHADNGTTIISVPVIADRPMNGSPMEEAEKRQRLKLLLDYMRKEGPDLVPGLSGIIRSPFRSVGRVFGMDSISELGDEAGFLIPLFQPVATMMTPPSLDEAQALWLSPEYHHRKGILPFRDSLILGVNFRQQAWNDRVQFDVRPFYGQNWVSTDGYWGTEFGISLKRKEASDPWGRIALRYTDGASALVDNGHGFDMHTEIRFDKNLALHAGVRESGNSDLGDYVLLRWKLTGF